MTKFLAIINRYEFAQFYRFGYMCISTSELLPFTEIDSKETKSNLVSRFNNKTPFEYDEEYLIIHLCQEIDNQNNIQKFLITDIKSIYPLSRQAKQSIQERIDSRIKLEEPIFDSIIPTVISNIQNNEIEMAISALWTIFELDGSIDLIKQKIGIDYIFKGMELRTKGVKAFQTKNENIWTILIAYDRFEYFPNTTLGYFFDSGQVFAYSKNTNFENSKLFKLLKSIKEDSKTDKIIIELNNTENSQSYITNTNFDGLKFHIVAPLYLMLKDDLRNSDDLKKSKYFTKSSLEYLKSFGDEFKAAIILLGSFFGYKKIYDLYYDKSNLSFFKTYKQIVPIENNTQAEIIKVVEVQKLDVPKTEIELANENKANNNVEKEENKIIVQNETNEVVETVKSEIQTNEVERIIENPTNEISSTEQNLTVVEKFNIENFIVDILKQQTQISLTDLADKIKIARNDKKKITNTELEKEIAGIEMLEVTQKAPKKAQHRTGFFLKTNT